MIDFEKMRLLAEKIDAASTEERIAILKQLKHEYILAMVTFIMDEYKEHRKDCEHGGMCDWCDGMLVWAEKELAANRIELHTNVVVNMSVSGFGAETWLGEGSKDIEEAIGDIIPQIKAQISRGQREGIVNIARKSPKDKSH